MAELHRRHTDDADDEEALRERMHERTVEGLEELSDEEREDVVEAAERNPDDITRRETIEQELMELGRSEEGKEIGD